MYDPLTVRARARARVRASTRSSIRVIIICAAERERALTRDGLIAYHVVTAIIISRRWPTRPAPGDVLAVNARMAFYPRFARARARVRARVR